ncbi:MAG: SPOR domain-containing protein [Firmicutes bacterium]|nr:SPOR domain-containing protein [Bacillota bacterium]
MARKKKKVKRSKALERVYLILTLVAVAGVAVFLGYVVGQYAIQAATGALDRDLVQEGEKVRREVAQTAEKMRLESDIQAADEPTSGIEVKRQEAPVTSEPLPLGESSGVSVVRESPSPPAVQKAAPPSVAAPPSSKQLYRVQVGAFSSEANARGLADELNGKGYQAIVVPGPLYRVQVGAFSERDNAETLKRELEGKGYPAVITSGQ